MKNFYRFLFLFALLPLAAMGQEYGWHDAGTVQISEYHYSTLSASQDIRFVDVPYDVDFKVYAITSVVTRENGSESTFTVHLNELTLYQGVQENKKWYILNLSKLAGVIIYASKPGKYKYQTLGNNSQHRASSSTEGSCPSYTYSFSNMLVPGDDNLTIGEVMANATLSPEVTAFIEEFGEPSAASKRRAEENEGEKKAGIEESCYYYKLTVGSKEGYGGYNRFGFFWGAEDGSGNFMIPAGKCALSIPKINVSSSIRLTNTSLILGEEDGLVSRLELVPMGDAPAFPAATGFYDLSGKSYPAYLSKNANGCLRGITIENGRKTIR